MEALRKVPLPPHWTSLLRGHRYFSAAHWKALEASRVWSCISRSVFALQWVVLYIYWIFRVVPLIVLSVFVLLFLLVPHIQSPSRANLLLCSISHLTYAVYLVTLWAHGVLNATTTLSLSPREYSVLLYLAALQVALCCVLVLAAVRLLLSGPAADRALDDPAAQDAEHGVELQSAEAHGVGLAPDASPRPAACAEPRGCPSTVREHYDRVTQQLQSLVFVSTTSRSAHGHCAREHDTSAAEAKNGACFSEFPLDPPCLRSSECGSPDRAPTPNIVPSSPHQLLDPQTETIFQSLMASWPLRRFGGRADRDAGPIAEPGSTTDYLTSYQKSCAWSPTESTRVGTTSAQ